MFKSNFIDGLAVIDYSWDIEWISHVPLQINTRPAVALEQRSIQLNVSVHIGELQWLHKPLAGICLKLAALSSA